MTDRYLLVAVATGDEDTTWKSLEELALLLETAGGETAESFVQNLAHPDPATYVGSGKARELKVMVDAFEADGIICDDELSPTQLKNLSEILDCRVLDRTQLILDIFAQRATTSEGKVQVEMAQLQYRMSHLRGIGRDMSRLGGGIGTRGPGETKLETDRRAIQRRITSLRRDIESMKRVRETTRKRRNNGMNMVAAIVGYTNAGKSTLLNRLTGSDVYVQNQLFATLDPTTRICKLPEGEEILFTDTVGFISKLPHQLIDAFKSTLEEAKYADVIIHVVDGTDENAQMHMDVVYKTLSDLGVTGKPVVTLVNKTDLQEEPIKFLDPRADKTIYISAKTGDGIEAFYEELQNILREGRKFIDEVIPYAEGSRLDSIRKFGQILSEEYTTEGVHVTAYIEE